MLGHVGRPHSKAMRHCWFLNWVKRDSLDEYETHHGGWIAGGQKGGNKKVWTERRGHI